MVNLQMYFILTRNINRNNWHKPFFLIHQTSPTTNMFVFAVGLVWCLLQLICKPRTAQLNRLD